MSDVEKLDQIEARANAAAAHRGRYDPDSLLVSMLRIIAGEDVPWLIEQVRKREAAIRAVHQIAFDPDIVSALEHGVISDGPGVAVGISAPEAMGYAVEALRDIRCAIAENLT